MPLEPDHRMYRTPFLSSDYTPLYFGDILTLITDDSSVRYVVVYDDDLHEAVKNTATGTLEKLTEAVGARFLIRARIEENL